MTEPRPSTEPPLSTDTERRQAAAWFAQLRDRVCTAFETLEGDAAGQLGDRPPGRFERRDWQRPGGGGGTMALMAGRVFEKVGVNVSVVHGIFSEEFRAQIEGAEADGAFWAAGISLVAHMQNPFVPAVHMNLRHIATRRSWFGGGADLTPMYPAEADAGRFHDAMRSACDAADPTYYEKFRAWCDRYFHLPHRQEPRGAGGIFFDQLNTGAFSADFAFAQAVGEAFLTVYPAIVRDNVGRAWTEDHRQHQLQRRGRYVEFNLLYDRGTMFGLKTGGNVEAILMSLPPMVSWP